MKTLAILFALCLASVARAETYVWDGVVWVQCGPQGCCPPQYSQPRYSQPRQRQRPQPDGIFTPPVGAPGTPDFHPNCPGIPPNTPPLPPPPPVQTPPMQPPAPKPEPATQPAPDTKAIDKLTTINQQILIAIEKQGGCKCEPVDLRPLEAKIDALIKAVAAIKIPPPVVCPPPVVSPPTTTAPPAPEEHVVIVADHNAPYWQRLAEAINNAKKTYHGLQETAPPTFPIGIHPQAVVYRNSVPIRIVKGQYEVEALLSRLARGEPI